MSTDQNQSNSNSNMKGLKKMYANAKPVINPEHRYDRQATFLRIKDLLEERARSLNRVLPGDRPVQGWKPQTFEDKYIYPYMDDISPQYPNDSDISSSEGQKRFKQNNQFQAKVPNDSKKFSMIPKKDASPTGPERTVFRGAKNMPYTVYSSSYGTYPNHAILSVGNAEQGTPRWEIRAVPRDAPLQDTQPKRKVTIVENEQGKKAERKKPEKMDQKTQRALKSILKKGTTYPLPKEILKKIPKQTEIQRQTPSEEMLMLAKENAVKRQAINTVKRVKENIPVVEMSTLNDPKAPFVTWLKPTFVNYATSEMVAMPDAAREQLSQMESDSSTLVVTPDIELEKLSRFDFNPDLSSKSESATTK